MNRIRRIIPSLVRPQNERAEKDKANGGNFLSYIQWCTLLDEIVENPRNDEYIERIRSSSVSWTSGVAERFVQSVAEMIRKRINRAVDVYQRQMRTARGSDTDVSRALATLTKEYRYLYQLTQALPIPKEHVEELTNLVQEHADRTQQSLMDSAKSDRTGRLGAIVRSAGVNKLSVRS